MVPSWHCVLESCSAALCDDPVSIKNGTVTFNGNSVGDIATYICDSGFELIGNATTTCSTFVDMNIAEFQPAPPSCRREYIEYKYKYKLPGMTACHFQMQSYSSMCFIQKIYQCIYVRTCMGMGSISEVYNY